ncbi:MAG: hypothetical protein WBP29_12460 [Candidatus Zixiibacteriota bacterium]
MSLVNLLKSSVRWRHRIMPLQLSYGREFRNKSAFLIESLIFSEEQLFQYSWSRVTALLKFAYENTEFYRETLDAISCKPQDIKTPDDYLRLPTTNRQIVRDNLEFMKPRNFAATHPIKTVTSGTTGFPLKLYRSRAHEALRKAIVWRHYNACGYFFKEPRATLGRPLEFPQKHNYTHEDLLENNLWLNSFHLNPNDFRHIYDGLANWNPKMLVGHPSAIFTFCLQSERAGLKPIKIPIVYSYSEKLYPHHVAKFRAYFGAEVFDYYGNRENTIAVTQQPCGNYHINSEFGFVEFVANGKHAAKGETGSIITTSLENYSIPLLRYDTGDLGRSLGRCGKCTMSHPTMEILGGRGKDILVTRDGFINCHLDTYLARNGFLGADYIQVVQKEIDRIIVRILPNSNYLDSRDREHLQRLTRDCLSGYFEVGVELIDQPPFTESGKMPYVVSELARAQLGENQP